MCIVRVPQIDGLLLVNQEGKVWQLVRKFTHALERISIAEAKQLQARQGKKLSPLKCHFTLIFPPQKQTMLFLFTTGQTQMLSDTMAQKICWDQAPFQRAARAVTRWKTNILVELVWALERLFYGHGCVCVHMSTCMCVHVQSCKSTCTVSVCSIYIYIYLESIYEFQFPPFYTTHIPLESFCFNLSPALSTSTQLSCFPCELFQQSSCSLADLVPTCMLR